MRRLLPLTVWSCLALPLASRQAPGETLNLPLCYEWGFETPTQNGADIFSMEEVPIFLDERVTQPDWMQLFGSEADVEQPDRFPRQPLAQFTRRLPREGRRCLYLESSGDHLLIQLIKRKPLLEEVEVRLEGWVRMRHLNEGSLRAEIRFFEGRFEIPGTRLSAEPLRGDRDWSPDLRARGRVPKGADSFDVRLLLEGSYFDKLAMVWIDTLKVEVYPACRIRWPGRAASLAAAGEPLLLEVECAGLSPGTYPVQVELERAWPAGEEAGWRFTGQRFVAESGQPLRFLEDLRSLLARDEKTLLPGLYRVGVQVQGAPGAPGAQGESHFVQLESGGSRSEAAAKTASNGPSAAWHGPRLEPPVQLGWVLRPQGQQRAGELMEAFLSQPANFPFQQILLEWGDGTKVLKNGQVPGGARAAGSNNGSKNGPLSFSWLGKVRWSKAGSQACLELVRRSAGLVREWEIAAASPLSAEEENALAGLRQEFPELSFGAPVGARGERPRWAQFRVLEVTAETPVEAPPEGAASSSSADPKDWVVIDLPRGLDGAGKAALLGRLAFQSIRQGFRRLLVDEPWEFFYGTGEGPGTPAPGFAEAILPSGAALLGLLKIEEWVESAAFMKELSPDLRTSFLWFQDPAGGDRLIIFSRGQEPVPVSLWTGVPLPAEDLAGRPSGVKFNAAEGTLELPAGDLPVCLSSFPAARFETAWSLRRSAGELLPKTAGQKLAYTIKNFSREPLELNLEIEPPPGWRLKSAPAAQTLPPGKEGEWAVEVFLPRTSPHLKDYLFSLRLKMVEGGKTYQFTRADKVPLRSEIVGVEAREVPPPRSASSPFAEEPHFPFLVRNRAARPIRLKVFAKALLGKPSDPLETWSGVTLAPQAEKELSLKLPADVQTLLGKELWVGVQVIGTGSSHTYSFRVESQGDRLVFER
ncbi:MAG: hypothetical protein HY717_09785 [Planctomycetes bacterium]|nr:hypothetical protein [Planctomycetota bacterium]